MASVYELVPTVARRWLVRNAPRPVVSTARRVLVKGARADLISSRHRLLRLRDRLVVRHGPAWTAVSYRGRCYAAWAVCAFRCDEVASGNLTLVTETLRGADVDHVLLSTATLDQRVVVRETDAARVLTALAARDDRPVHAAWGADRPRPVSDLPTRRAGQRALRVFEFCGTVGGDLLAGPELACTVELWDEVRTGAPVVVDGEPVPAGGLVARIPNRWAAAVPPAAQLPVAHPHLFSVTFPVDVVFTWVDGDDPHWRSAKESALRANGMVSEQSASPARFTSRDELRYALRSVEMYAPWVRNVYLVTADQVPAWLDSDHPRLLVVDHTDLFAGAGRLPTFNSHAIESQLHKLPGVAEHFLYFNDDFFLGRPVSPELFFTSSGLSRFFPSRVKIGLGAATGEDTPVMAAAKNNRDLLRDRFGVTVTNRLRHAPYALRRSVLRELAEMFPMELGATANAQFRSHTDYSVASSLHHYYGYVTGRAVPADLAFGYVDLGHPALERQLVRILDRPLDAFCVNETEIAAADPRRSAQALDAFCRRKFPLPSGYERPALEMTGRSHAASGPHAA